jgi:hypothetical protein
MWVKEADHKKKKLFDRFLIPSTGNKKNGPPV